MPPLAHERGRVERAAIVVGVDDDRNAGGQGLVRQRRERHRQCGRHVHLLDLLQRPEVPHTQHRVRSQDALGEIGRGDVINGHLRRGRPPAPIGDRGSDAEQPGDNRQRGMQVLHARLRSMRVASAKPAIAASVTTAVPVPRDTPARSVIVTAPSGVLA